MDSKTSKTTYHGSCLCGEFEFSIAITPSKLPVQCNCAICSKKGALWLFLDKSEDITVQKDEGKLVSYTFDQKYWSHEFCGTCGVNVKVATVNGGWPMAINARTLKGFDINAKQPKLNDGKASGVKYQPKPYKGTIPVGVEGATELYRGSCHCGAVTYAAKAVETPEIYGQKKSSELFYYGISVTPVKKGAQFLGAFAAPMTTYSLGNGQTSVKFCSVCGVTAVVLGAEGIAEDHLLLNLKTLDVKGNDGSDEQPASH